YTSYLTPNTSYLIPDTSHLPPALTAFYPINGHFTYIIFFCKLLMCEFAFWILQYLFYAFHLRGIQFQSFGTGLLHYFICQFSGAFLLMHDHFLLCGPF